MQDYNIRISIGDGLGFVTTIINLVKELGLFASINYKIFFTMWLVSFHE